MALVIGVTGISGSGKSRLCSLLAEGHEERITVLCQDSFYNGCGSIDPDVYNFDDLSSLDVESIKLAIHNCKNRQQPNEIPVYDHSQHKRTGYRNLDPTHVVLVEGHMMFQDPAIRDAVDYLLFVDTDMDIAIVRRLKRDIAERGRNVNEVTSRYMRHVRQASLKTLEIRSKADFVIPNNNSFTNAANLLQYYIESVLDRKSAKQ
ncbi:uridine kinase family protein [Marinomonas mediterranea]|jgi:Uridine kinase|uniref:Uridine kinase n=1 Tax=Marinomonas mediterranea (strain ATCC 700492 / JCM 21426 / NBRC 103028 / MMB-1) TaxID=717774 RepID=F2K0E9_MARM1|nr:uridine kinase [Marinomonas mediterranea]ADZ89864.1 Uridine kinase [Marinomonas mediterranea MMB-1]WCN07949.1 uridine kinase [Marinomonas mediterranea]WCN12044.1 uridine kinase [Marinomonas mediterranea]WCN16082.1 uridine kinase [Marinomonas mediterranea MMB-1]